MRVENLLTATLFNGNLEQKMNSFNDLFFKISEYFSKLIDVDKFEPTSVGLLKDIEKKGKNKFNSKYSNFSLNEWLSDINVTKIKELSEFYINDIKTKYEPFKSAINDLLKLINSNFNLIISQCEIFKTVYTPSTVDLIKTLNNYFKFLTQENFNEEWYLKIIFKELYSNLDKISVDYSLIKTVDSWIDNNVDHATYFDNDKVQIFKTSILEKKVNKWQIVILENYENHNNSITFKFLENKILKRIENEKMWVTLKIFRDKMEHSWADLILFKNKSIKQGLIDNLKYFNIYLIGLNIYLLHNIWNLI